MSHFRNSGLIDNFSKQIQKITESAEEKASTIDDWSQEIESIKEVIEKQNSENNVISNTIKTLAKEIEKNKEILAGLAYELNKSIKLNEEQQKEIQKTIEDANRLGMAGAFKKRKDELKRAHAFWTVATLITLCGLLWLSYNIVAPLIHDRSIDIMILLKKIPVFVSAVWLGWFCTKQYGFTARIVEDYAYKYAVSMAFEGYKNASREIDEELLKALLELTILNISSNPVNIFNTKTNHGTPYNETIQEIFKKLKIDGKVNVEAKFPM